MLGRLLAFLGVLLLAGSAYANCSSITVGETTFFNCDGQLTTQQRVGSYTFYQPKFPASERKQPAWKRDWNSSRNVSRETYRPSYGSGHYDWQRHSR